MLVMMGVANVGVGVDVFDAAVVVVEAKEAVVWWCEAVSESNLERKKVNSVT
jgi:hypothetical protein